jgi:hypothetical protein
VSSVEHKLVSTGWQHQSRSGQARLLHGLDCAACSAGVSFFLFTFFSSLVDLLPVQDVVPIAVFITLDIVKTAQAKFIDNDLLMKDSDGGHAEARTSNLNEELGCVRRAAPSLVAHFLY